MKSVSVQLSQGWDTESWKLARLFPKYREMSESVDSSIISLQFVSSECRLSPEGDLGFPKDGIPIRIRLYNRYKELRDVSGITISDVDFSDLVLPVPTAFESKLTATFERAIGVQTNLHIFRALREVERHISDIWIQSVLDFSIKAEAERIVTDVEIGKLSLTAPGRVILKKITCAVECAKCNVCQADFCFSLLEGRIAGGACPSCDGHWEIRLSSNQLYGQNVIVSLISNISAWALCPCGKDCCFLSKIKIEKPSKAQFSCGCPNMDMTAAYEPRSGISTFHMVRNSPKLKLVSSPTRKYKQGVALPQNGVCKHYKKSFRWMMFNCCDEWYACKQCHDSRATCHGIGDDEELPPSSEMMCGFCSKQQPLENTCAACGKMLTPGWSAKEKVTTEKKRRPPRWKRRS